MSLKEPSTGSASYLPKMLFSGDARNQPLYHHMLPSLTEFTEVCLDADSLLSQCVYMTLKKVKVLG